MAGLDLSNKQILVTGGAGFLGRQVIAQLLAAGANSDQIRVVRSKDYDLTTLEACQRAVDGQNIIIHLAAHVGGIGLNQAKPAELFYDNLMMGVQLIHTAHLAGVEKFVCVGTICAYPKFTPVPFKEDDIWNGYPEETNAPYGVAKKALLVQLQSYRQQYGFDGIYLLPVNLYGPEDNFDPSSSHVIPALIRRFHEAKERADASVTIWGTGTPRREFLHVDDLAAACFHLLDLTAPPDWVNVGVGSDVTILQLSEMVADTVGFSGKIVTDPQKPDGTPRKLLDISTIRQTGWQPVIPLDQGLKAAYQDFLSGLESGAVRL